MLIGTLFTVGLYAQVEGIRPTVVAGDLDISGSDTTGEMLYYDHTTGTWKTTYGAYLKWSQATRRLIFGSTSGITIGSNTLTQKNMNGITWNNSITATDTVFSTVINPSSNVTIGSQTIAQGNTNRLDLNNSLLVPDTLFIKDAGNYITEASADVVDINVGGVNMIKVTEGMGIDKINFKNADVYVDSTLYAGRVDWAIPNLLTNHDFLCNSQATVATAADANTGFAYDLNDPCTGDLTANYAKKDGLLTFDTDHYVMTEVAATQVVSFGLSGLTAGALYKFNVDLQNGTYTLATTDNITAATAAGTTIATTALATSVAMTEFSVYWVAAGTSDSIRINTAMGAGETYFIDDIQVSEVSQAYLAADTKAPDGWVKSTTDIDLYTVDAADSLPTGAVRGLRIIPAGASKFIQYTEGAATNVSWYKKFAGRTVIFSCWAKTATASHLRLRAYDGSYTSSSYHTGGNTWELISVTVSISSSTTNLAFQIATTNAAGQVLICNLQLSYGTSIGQYSPQRGVVWLDDQVYLNNYNNVTISADVTGINLTAQTLGKVAAGGNAVYFTLRGSCSTASKYLGLNSAWDNPLVIYSQVSNIPMVSTGWIKLITNKFDIQRNDTFNPVYILATGIEY